MSKRSKQDVDREATESDEETSDLQYHAVTLLLPANACDAAKALNGERFLAADAPIFPVERCDVRSCNCGYEHHDDRRGGPRRMLDIGISDDFRTDDGERRESSDRRHEVQRNDEESADEPTDYFIYVRTR